MRTPAWMSGTQVIIDVRVPVIRPGRQPPWRNCSPTNCGCSAPTTPTPWPPATTWHRGEAGPATRPGQPTEPVALSSLARPGAGPTIESPTVPHAPTFSAPPTPCCSAPPRPRAPPCSGHVQATVPTPPARASPRRNPSLRSPSHLLHPRRDISL